MPAQRNAYNDLATLQGTRFVTAMETNRGRKLDEARVKLLAGGDRVTARRLYEEYFSFEPTHHLWISGNHKPDIPEDDDAMWRRMKLIPFSVKIPKEKKDSKLPEKLMDEAEGILAWAVKGCLEWQQHGLGEPKEVSLATADYRQEMDTVEEFIEACCVMDPAAFELTRNLLDAYKEHTGDKAMTPKMFAKRLKQKGLVDKKTTQANGFLGLKLRTETDHGFIASEDLASVVNQLS